MATSATRNNFRKNSESAPAPSSSCSILIFDSNSHRKWLLNGMLSNGAAELALLDISSTVVAEQSLRPAAIVLVALDSKREAALQIVQTLRTSCGTILCYADGSDEWPLRSRCEPLIAGAQAVLDSTDPGFCEAVAERIHRLLCDGRAVRDSTDAIRASMRRFGLIGCSEAMLSVFRKIIRFGPISDLAVLILGETGTGKELAARAIHALDPKRRYSNFIPVNCGAITASLAESELFGHRPGAFTGAKEARKGLFRAANGGTLFLDEIGEMDLALQAKLLRVLQELRVLTVGDDQEVPVDVRVIAASNRNLAEAVTDGTFRADLLHRINVLTFTIPPLRERRQDVEELINYVLEERRSATGERVPSAGRDFVQALQAIELRGNARELINLIHHALANKQNDTNLGLHDLKPEVWREIAEQGRKSSGSPATSVLKEPGTFAVRLHELLEMHAGNLQQSVDCCEKLLLEEALRKTNGNQSQAARILGITVRSVYNKLRKYQLHGAK